MSKYLPILFFAALVGLLVLGLRHGDPSDLPSALRGKAVPEFTLDGFTAADLKSGQPALLNVWASWCAPCRVEHPALMMLQAKGVPIYGLNYKDNPKNAARFLARRGNPYRKIGVDDTGRVAIDFGVYGVPETFLIDSDGVILARHAGALTPSFIAEIALVFGLDIMPRQ